jgi:hypothetical protein
MGSNVAFKMALIALAILISYTCMNLLWYVNDMQQRIIELEKLSQDNKKQPLKIEQFEINKIEPTHAAAVDSSNKPENTPSNETHKVQELQQQLQSLESKMCVIQD